MRAGPLSSSKVIQLLNTHFVNVWVLLRELPELQDGAKGSAAAALVTKLQEHFVYPVDSLILTPELNLVEHLPTNEFLLDKSRTERSTRYLELLKSALAQVDRN